MGDYKPAEPKDGELTIEEELSSLKESADNKEVKAGKAANVKYFKEYTQNVLNALVSDAVTALKPDSKKADASKTDAGKADASKTDASKTADDKADASKKTSKKADDDEKALAEKKEADLRVLTNKNLEAALDSMKKIRVAKVLAEEAKALVEESKKKAAEEAKKAPTAADATTPAEDTTQAPTAAKGDAKAPTEEKTEESSDLTVEEFNTVVAELAKTVQADGFVTEHGVTMYGKDVESFRKVWNPTKTEKKTEKKAEKKGTDGKGSKTPEPTAA